MFGHIQHFKIIRGKMQLKKVLLAVISSVLLYEKVVESSYYGYSGQYLLHPKWLSQRIFQFIPQQDISKEVRMSFDTQNTLKNSDFLEYSTNPYVPRCRGNHERYDPETEKCHSIGATGPCGPLMVFTGNEYINPEDRIFGHCECDTISYERPLIVIGGQCHFKYTQGTYKNGYWLVNSMKMGAVCKQNPCYNKAMSKRAIFSSSEIVPFEGHCVKLNFPSNLCPNDDDIVSFKRGFSEPLCVTRTKTRIFRRQVAKTNELKCQEGYAKVRGHRGCLRTGRVQKRY